jgi:hypothetical protein
METAGAVGFRVTPVGCSETGAVSWECVMPSDLDITWVVPQDDQKGRPARPQQAKRRGVRFGTLSL